MKILHVFSYISPNANGTISLLRHLTPALARRGHEVGIFTSDFELNNDYINSFSPVIIYSYPSGLNLKWLYLFFSPAIMSKAKRAVPSFEILHLHCLRSLQNIVVWHYARKYGIPYVIDAHGSTLRIARNRGVKWLLQRLYDMLWGYRLLRGASKVIAETEVGIKEYKDLGVPGEKIVLLEPAFAIEEYSKLPPWGRFRDKYKIKDRHIVMFFGRINWIKGVDFLTESFSELLQLKEDVILVFVGPDDGYKSQLEQIISTLNIADKVLFTGFLSGDDKLSALVDADVVIQTSRHEQGAWAPFEAILCGTPIIVTEHTGAGEDVKEIDAGYLAEFGNKKALAQLIVRVLEDPAEARAKAQRAAQYLREHRSLDNMVTDYEKVYLQCIEEIKNVGRGTK